MNNVYLLKREEVKKRRKALKIAGTKIVDGERMFKLTYTNGTFHSYCATLSSAEKTLEKFND